ncbi:MAG: hypothetical protein K0R36_426 [Chryseobacterium sp.]|jgi:hypothetical protein|nr:hypothetical protein [Chryseobacterium sp.]
MFLNKDEIKKAYNKLLSDKISPQKRGYEFEVLINSLLSIENLEPKASYKPTGEQIDGSFFWQGQTFLLEAKWVKDKVPVSSIYSFKGKLDGKFHTTSGIFIAINGYSKDVEDALRFGKALNIILFNEMDIPPIFNNEVSFLDVLKFKLREAGDTGSLNASYDLKQKAKRISQLSTEFISMHPNNNSKSSNQNILIDDLLVFVEGLSDIWIVRNLLEQIKEHYSLSYKIEVLQGAGNVRQLPSLLNIYGEYEQPKAVIVILDDDQATLEMESIIKNVSEQLEKSSIPIKPMFLFIGENFKNIISSNDTTLEQLRNESTFERFENFIWEIAEEYQDYYDPETSIPDESFKGSMDNLTWNYEDGVLDGTDEYTGHPFEIKSIEDLVEHLNEEAIRTMHGEMPISWINEREYLDYDIEAREFLIENYIENIKKIGWNENDL